MRGKTLDGNGDMVTPDQEFHLSSAEEAGHRLGCPSTSGETNTVGSSIP